MQVQGVFNGSAGHRLIVWQFDPRAQRDGEHARALRRLLHEAKVRLSSGFEQSRTSHFAASYSIFRSTFLRLTGPLLGDSGQVLAVAHEDHPVVPCCSAVCRRGLRRGAGLPDRAGGGGPPWSAPCGVLVLRG